MNKYDKLFLEQARLGYSNFIRKYHRKIQYRDLFERKHLLNKEFDFSAVNGHRLQTINDILLEKSESSYLQAEKLEQYVLTAMENQDTFISDYEIGFTFCFFAENKYAISRTYRAIRFLSMNRSGF